MARNKITDIFEKLLNSNPFKNYFKADRLRPPGAVDEEQFMELCIRCARCIEVCPYDSIRRADLYEKLQIGTPYIFADKKACYLCMRCMKVCPTGALDPKLKEPEKVRMGLAVINQKTCLNFLYYKDEMGGVSLSGMAQLCSTCYNACPLQDKAILLEKSILPVITDKCTGCGICAEKCPTSPKSVVIYPEGMPVKENAGFYGRKTRVQAGHSSPQNEGVLKGDELLKQKQMIDGSGEKPKFHYNMKTYENKDEWQEQ